MSTMDYNGPSRRTDGRDTARRAGWAALAVATVVGGAGLYREAVAFGRWERAHAPAPPEPLVSRTRPGNDDRGVLPNAFIAADVYLPNYGSGIDSRTMNTRSVHLYRVDAAGKLTPVDGHVNTSGAGDAIVFQPSDFLDCDATYRFVCDGVRDTTGAKFKYYQTDFHTAVAAALSTSPVAFEQVPLPLATGIKFTTLAIGPDGRLYAATADGPILRYDIGPGGLLSTQPFVVRGILNGNRGPDDPSGGRLVTGICFDPASTAADPVLWVTNGVLGVENCPDWSCKLSRLTGPDLDRCQDYVVGLPRAWRDHLSFKIAMHAAEPGVLYFDQGSSSSTGAADNKWGLRDEHLLTAACLRVDLRACERWMAAHGGQPLNVKTEDDGRYDPFAPDAPLTLYATGLRCGFGLLWHSNGHLYSCLNGGAAGGAAPGTPDDLTAVPRRVDQRPYAGGPIAAIPDVSDTQPDIMVDIVKGGYYGHPNVTRGEYVLFGGNPVNGPAEDLQYRVRDYPKGTPPDRNWHRPAWNLGISLSCNGLIEYHGPAFGGALDGKILTTRYSGGKDVLILTALPDGRVVEADAGISGFTGFIDPLDLVEDPASGNLYVSEYGGFRLTLLRPNPASRSIRVLREQAAQPGGGGL